MRRARWPLLLAVVVGAALIVVVVAGGGDDEPTATTTTRPGPLQEAVLRAEVDVEGVADDDVATLIQDVCDSGDAERLGVAVVALGTVDPDQIRAVIEGVGRGAQSLCPDVPAEQPELLNEAYAAALGATEG